MLGKGVNSTQQRAHVDAARVQVPHDSQSLFVPSVCLEACELLESPWAAPAHRPCVS